MPVRPVPSQPVGGAGGSRCGRERRSLQATHFEVRTQARKLSQCDSGTGPDLLSGQWADSEAMCQLCQNQRALQKPEVHSQARVPPTTEWKVGVLSKHRL